MLIVLGAVLVVAGLLWPWLKKMHLVHLPADIGATFRQLLLEVRQELAYEYLNRPEMDVTEVAFLLGYEDSNSFYRAFRTWEGTTPSQLRAALRRSETRQ
jgi:AraC-like DNA-binding protein